MGVPCVVVSQVVIDAVGREVEGRDPIQPSDMLEG